MKLIPCDEKAIATVKNVRSDNFKLLMDFAERGIECAKVEGYPHKNADSCAVALRIAIKKYRLFTIGVVVRKEDVYLIRKKPIVKKQ